MRVPTHLLNSRNTLLRGENTRREEHAKPPSRARSSSRRRRRRRACFNPTLKCPPHSSPHRPPYPLSVQPATIFWPLRVDEFDIEPKIAEFGGIKCKYGNPDLKCLVGCSSPPRLYLIPLLILGLRNDGRERPTLRCCQGRRVWRGCQGCFSWVIWKWNFIYVGLIWASELL